MCCFQEVGSGPVATSVLFATHQPNDNVVVSAQKRKGDKAKKKKRKKDKKEKRNHRNAAKALKLTPHKFKQ